MKTAALLVFVAITAAQAVDVKKLSSLMPTMPLHPQYTWDKWNEIMANQKVVRDHTAVNSGTEPQPADAGFAYPPLDTQSRVVGGTIAKQGQIPWQAAIVTDDSSFCGGSLISATYVLTVAECTCFMESFQVTLGASNIETPQSGVVIQTSRNLVRHEKYNYVNRDYDIAVIVLETPVVFTSYIRAIRLPRTSQAAVTFQDMSVIVSGFGRISTNYDKSPDLRYASLTVISNTQCEAFHSDKLNAQKMCTTGVSGRNPCQGDFGGPLFIKEDDGLYTQVGLFSFGHYQCSPTEPAMFTRITSYLDWISTKTGIAIRP